MNQLTVAQLPGTYGMLWWDLAPNITYTPGTALSFRVIVTNVTYEPRTYSLKLELTQLGTAYPFYEETVSVDGNTEFEVEARGRKEIALVKAFDITNVLLSAVLYDCQTGRREYSVSSTLRAPGAYTPPVDITNWILPIVGLALVGAMVGMVVPIMKKGLG